MTAAHSITTTPNPHPTGRVREMLELVHRAWLQDLQSALQPPGENHSDILSRWRAIRYLDTVFSARFDRERRSIDRLSPALGDGQQRQLWAAGELVALSLWQAGHAIGLCHNDAGFTNVTETLVRSVEYWSGSVEAIVGPMNWDDVPTAVRTDLTALATGDTAC